MRPSDEHQHRSKRPNLFSSARGKSGADDNILARLDRMPAETAPTAAPRARIVLLAGAGVLIAGLIIALASLTRDNVSAPQRMQVSTPVVAAPTASSAAQHADGATILDEAVAAPSSKYDVALVVSEPATTRESKNLPAHLPATATAPPEQIPAVQPPRPTTTPVSAERIVKAQQVAARPSVQKSPRRAAPAASDDPDVAILAAILSQAPRHAPDKSAEPECGGTRGKPCPSSQF